jgi:RNA polymerase sigma-70 factor (ECF subfamily)
MTATTSTAITALLRRAAAGDGEAEEQLLSEVYGQLHQLARRQMRKERGAHTLQATALVNEAYVRLLRGAPVSFRDRNHFLSLASRVMRQILVDHARKRATSKRGSGEVVASMNSAIIAAETHSPETILLVDGALNDLAKSNPRQARIVELRFFAGMTEEEIAGLLEISSRTVKRDWTIAKAWLYQRLDFRPSASTRTDD